MLDDETRYRLLKLLESNPNASQRLVSQELGMSLGKVNYCIRALIEKGWVKAQNFTKSKNKRAYAYFLTPSGIEQKAAVTARFLKRKMEEYDALKKEIDELRRDVAANGSERLRD